MVSHKDFDRANRRGKNLRSASPLAVAAHYDRRLDRVVVRLSSGLDVAFSPHDAQGLKNAKASQLDKIEISPSGFGLYFPKLDADIYLPALLQGFFGSRKWMAARLGAVGGKSRSAAKAAAAQRNGTFGGRPRKFRELQRRSETTAETQRKRNREDQRD
jgi:hypothetical protein